MPDPAPAQRLTFDRPPTSAGRGKTVALLAAYGMLSLAVTWPAAGRMMDAVPLGSEGAATVPLLNLWTVWWNADRAGRGWIGYWNAPIFHPVEGAFALSEAQPLTALVAPVVWAARSPCVAYNVYFLFSLTLNGWMMGRLAMGAGAHHLIACVAGALTTALPYVHWQSGVLQLVPVWGVLWTVCELRRLAALPSRCAGLRLGMAFGITYLLCNHYGLFLSVLITASAPWLLGRQLGRRATWLALGAAALVGLLIVSPVVYAQVRWISHERGWRRPPEVVRALSAEPADYTARVVERWTDKANLSPPERARAWTLSPGLLCAGLGVLGALYAVSASGTRRDALFWLTLTLLAAGFSLGPQLQLAGSSPYNLLRDWWPGFAQVRSPFRFAAFVQLGCVALAAYGCSAVVAVGRYCRIRPRWCLLLGTLPALVALVENWPAQARMYPIAMPEGERHWSAELRDRTPGDAVIVCLPLPQGGSTRDFVSEAGWMWWQTFHRRPLVNGYSAFLPDEYRQLREALRDFPGTASLDQLGAVGVRYVVIDRAALAAEQQQWVNALPARLRPLQDGFAGEVRVYQLLPATATMTAPEAVDGVAGPTHGVLPAGRADHS